MYIHRHIETNKTFPDYIETIILTMLYGLIMARCFYSS